MPGSYRKINYALRPAKAIERRMLCTAFERLYPFQSVHNYRYIGFGSIYFSDFQLIHRALGITDMVSIEREASAKACFHFNRPFRCIRLKFATASEALPAMSWRRPSIVWLDYDAKLNTDILGDIATVCQRAASGSVLVVTVNAQPDAEPIKEDRDSWEQGMGQPFDLRYYRLGIAKRSLGEKLPAGTDGADLRGQGVARVFRNVIDNLVQEEISVRNIDLSEKERVQYRQLFHFHYKDGAQMVTVGGIFYRASEEKKFEACGFGSLPFVRNEAEPCTIRTPCLTPKEMRHLNAQLPKKASTRILRVPGVPDADVQCYADIYRYFPAFSEVLFS